MKELLKTYKTVEERQKDIGREQYKKKYTTLHKIKVSGHSNKYYNYKIILYNINKVLYRNYCYIYFLVI